tara:strand:+ start:1429 stop:1773 length:345 start_codon:yes stop_codon:yes gene_type:complete
MPRHGTEDLITNRNEFYEEFFEARGVDRIRHYRSPMLPPITVDVIRSFTREKYVWKLGDKYYKIAARAYGDPKLWWAIAWFNQKPTENDVKQGDVIYIPRPINKLLTYLNMGLM